MGHRRRTVNRGDVPSSSQDIQPKNNARNNQRNFDSQVGPIMHPNMRHEALHQPTFNLQPSRRQKNGHRLEGRFKTGTHNEVVVTNGDHGRMAAVRGGESRIRGGARNCNRRGLNPEQEYELSKGELATYHHWMDEKYRLPMEKYEKQLGFLADAPSAPPTAAEQLALFNQQSQLNGEQLRYLVAAGGDKELALRYQGVTYQFMADFNVEAEHAIDILTRANWIRFAAEQQMSNVVESTLVQLDSLSAMAIDCLPQELRDLMTLEFDLLKLRELVRQSLKRFRWDEERTTDYLKVYVLSCATNMDEASATKQLWMTEPSGDLAAAITAIATDARYLAEQSGFPMQDVMQCLQAANLTQAMDRLKQRLLCEVVQEYSVSQGYAIGLCERAAWQRTPSHNLARKELFEYMHSKTDMKKADLAALLKEHGYNHARVEAAIVECFAAQTSLHEDGCRQILENVDWNLARASEYWRRRDSRTIPTEWFVGGRN